VASTFWHPETVRRNRSVSYSPGGPLVAAAHPSDASGDASGRTRVEEAPTDPGPCDMTGEDTDPARAGRLLPPVSPSPATGWPRCLRGSSITS